MPSNNSVAAVDHGKKAWVSREAGSFDTGAQIVGLSVVRGGRAPVAIVGLNDGRLYRWEALGSIEGGSFHRSGQRDLIDISSGGNKILATSTDGSICLFDSDTLTLTSNIFVSEKNWPSGTSVSSDGLMGAVVAGNVITLLDLSQPTQQIIMTDTIDRSFSSVEFSPAGRYVAAGSQGKIVLWETAAFQSKALDWKGSHIDIFWSPDEQFVCSTTHDRELHVWNLTSGQDFRLGGFGRKIRHVAWNHVGSMLAAVSEENVVIWSLGTDGGFQNTPQELGAGADCGHCVDFAWVDEHRVVLLYEDGSILLSDCRTGSGEFLMVGSENGAGFAKLLSIDGWNAISATKRSVRTIKFPGE